MFLSTHTCINYSLFTQQQKKDCAILLKLLKYFYFHSLTPTIFQFIELIKHFLGLSKPIMIDF